MRSGCFLLRFGGRQASQHAVEDGSVRAQVVEPGRAVGLRGDGDRCEAARQVAAASNASRIAASRSRISCSRRSSVACLHLRSTRWREWRTIRSERTHRLLWSRARRAAAATLYIVSRGSGLYVTSGTPPMHGTRGGVQLRCATGNDGRRGGGGARRTGPTGARTGGRRTRSSGRSVVRPALGPLVRRAHPGCRATDISDAFGVNRSTVSRQLRGAWTRAGCDPRSARSGPAIHFT